MPAARDRGGRGGVGIDHARNVIIGKVLRELREDEGLSLDQASSRSGRRVKTSVLGAYERGERTLSIDKFEEVAAIYGVELGVLVSVVETRVGLTSVSGPVESRA
jgi:transcriptional regulator with XRE-family HTH domain